MIYQITEEEEIYSSIGYFERVGTGWIHDNYEIVCPFCTARYETVEEVRLAIECPLCVGKGKWAYRWSEHMIRLFTIIPNLRKETQLKYYGRMAKIVRGASLFEVRRRLQVLEDTNAGTS